MCEKNWGLNPKMTQWLDTMVIRPIITYRSVRWRKTQQAGVIRLLTGVPRLAWLCIIGAMRTTPTCHGNLTEFNTTIFAHTQRSKVCYIQTDTESNSHYTNE